MEQKIIKQTIEAWSKVAIDLILEFSQQALKERGEFSLVLSGGSTPKPVYSELVKVESALDLKRTFIFWGDERCVPPDHPESNYRLAQESILSRISLPQQNIFRMLGEVEPSAAAQDYEEMISAFFFKREKRFDLVLLGLGDDGHTASLFPGTPALEESTRWVVENPHPYSNNIRLTLTYPALNNARNILFLVTGENKAPVVKQILQKGDDTYPAARVTGSLNPPIWLFDQIAASQLK